MNNNLSEVFARSWDVPAVIDGVNVIYNDAYSTPPDLAEQLLAGVHPLLIWAEHENKSAAALVELFNMEPAELAKEARAQEPYINIRGIHIVNFCRTIAVHPAHLVPWDDNPFFSLHRGILEANMMVAHDKSQLMRDRELAGEAIAWEKRRFQRFMEGIAHGTGLSHMLQLAIDRGYYDSTFRQLNAYSSDGRMTALHLAPLVFEKFIMAQQEEYDGLQRRLDTLHATSNGIETALDRDFALAFIGMAVQDESRMRAADYAASLRDRSETEVTDRQLVNYSRRCRTLLDNITNMITDDVVMTTLSEPNEFRRQAIEQLAKSVLAFWQVQAKIDVFKEENRNEMDDIESRIEFLETCATLVSQPQTAHLRRLFVNYGLIERHEAKLAAANKPPCVLLRAPDIR